MEKEKVLGVGDMGDVGRQIVAEMLAGGNEVRVGPYPQKNLKGSNMKIETIGLVVSVVGVLPFFGGGLLNLTKSPVARKNIEHIGYSPYLITHFGLSVITFGILTLIPRTAFLGVILTTAWMGGAVAAHVRVKDKWTVSAGILIIPLLVWIGFGLRHQAEMHSLFGL